MRLDNFITESSNIDPYVVVSEVYNRSLPYIQELIREFHHINLKTPMLLSGRNSEDTIIVKQIRTNRYPKDTNYAAHEILDDIFDSIFHVRARSASIFVTGLYRTADSYGNKVYTIFPNGTDYKIIWSPSIEDLYSDIVDSGEYRHLGESLEDVINDLINGGSFYHDEARDNLAASFESDNSKDDFESEDDYMMALDDFVDSRLEDEVYDIARTQAEEEMGNSEYEIKELIRERYKEGHLKEAILSKNEIMLSGWSYTGVRYDYLPFILRYMEVHGAKKPTQHMFNSAMVGLDIKDFPNTLHMSQQTLRNRLSKATLASIDISDLKK